MLVTNSQDYFERARLLRSHGMTSMSYERAKGHSTAYDVIELGYNYRMDDIHSAIGLVQLNKVQADLEKRVINRASYLEKLNGIKEIIVPFANYHEFTSNYIFTIVLKDSNYKKRNRIREKLAEIGIQTSVHYPAVHLFSIYKDFFTQLPITEYLADNLITLPMYSKLTEEDINYIVKQVLKILHG